MLPGPLALLEDGRFLRLWSAGLLLGTTRWLEILGIALWTLAETDSALVVALMLFARTLPMVLLGVPMGALADRLNRRKLLATGVGCALFSSTILLTLALKDVLAVWAVAAGASVSGIVWTMEHPVRRALIADVVGVGRIGVALSLDSATFNATRMIGPLAGGTVYAALALEGVYGASLVMSLLAIAALLTLRVSVSNERDNRKEPFLASLTGGIAEVRANPILTAVMVTTIAANLFGFSYASMVPVVGERVLGLDAVMVGVLMSMEGLGAFSGALALAFFIRAPLYGRVFLAGALLFLSMILTFSFSVYLAASMVALFLAGVGIAGFGSMQSTILISNAAPAVRSRVMGVLVLCIGAGPPGILLVGGISNVVGAATALAITAGTGTACIALAALRWPALWRSPEGSAHGRGET